MSEDGQRPGDAARRALRAARRRAAETGTEETAPGEPEATAAPTTPDGPSVPDPSARDRGARDPGVPDPGVRDPALRAVRPEVSAVARSAGRPGDIAREALRAGLPGETLHGRVAAAGVPRTYRPAAAAAAAAAA